jgi:hypothetical protein
MTAEERMTVGVLGRGVLKAADALQAEIAANGTAGPGLWRNFLQALFDGAGDLVMGSPLGLAIQIAVSGKIREGETHDDANERRRSQSADFTGNRRC